MMLTREALEGKLAWALNADHGDLEDVLLAHDAALRQQVADVDKVITEQIRRVDEATAFYKSEQELVSHLKQQLADVTKERDNWHEIVKDDCDEDDLFRQEAGALDTSDGYGVDSHTDILKRVKQQLAERERERDEAIDYCAKAMSVVENYTALQQQLAEKLTDATEAWSTVNDRDQTILARDEQLETMEQQLAERDEMVKVAHLANQTLQATITRLEGALKRLEGMCTCRRKATITPDGGVAWSYYNHEDWCVMVIAQHALAPPPIEGLARDAGEA